MTTPRQVRLSLTGLVDNVSNRYEFYENDETLTLSIFDRGANPELVSVELESRKVCSRRFTKDPSLFTQFKLTYRNGDTSLDLQPLKGQIDPEQRNVTVGKVKVEVKLVKVVQGRWGVLIGDAPDGRYLFIIRVFHDNSRPPLLVLASYPAASTTASTATTKKKNWEGITKDILSREKETTTEQDPNVGGETAVNSFFKQIFADSDDDTRRAMMKSFQESGGTSLSTNWEEVKKGKVEGKAPEGSEFKKWN